MSGRPFVDAGAALAECGVLPALRSLDSQGVSQVERAHVYAGLLGALIGYMTADLGPDDAEALFRGFDKAFDEARALQAAAAGKGH